MVMMIRRLLSPWCRIFSGRRLLPAAVVPAAVLLAGVLAGGCTGDRDREGEAGAPAARYRPEHASLRTHPVPEWFHDAKLGVLITWGPYSVPGWAPLTGGLWEVIETHGWSYWFENNPYAEWYMNSMQIEGGAVCEYHRRVYGLAFHYEDFVPVFNQAVEQWDPEAMAAQLRDAGVRYVVLTARFADGFPLWPTAHPNPHRPAYVAGRDIVGELTAAVRSGGMRMGLYYCGGMDWTFNPTVIRNFFTNAAAMPEGQPYADYVEAQWRELIARYAPSILWNDIAFPPGADLYGLFADYYNIVPDGVVNNRWWQNMFGQIGMAGIEWINKLLLHLTHYDYATLEYSRLSEFSDLKWEATRGLGYSFGYNLQDEPAAGHLLSSDELVDMLADIVSKNGNLMIGLGPMADGTLPPAYAERLADLGRWLRTNGEAIYGTRPWSRVEAVAAPDGVRVRFTIAKTGDDLFAILLDRPESREWILDGVAAAAGLEVCLLGTAGCLSWEQRDRALAVSLPATLPDAPAHVLRFSPPPENLQATPLP